MAEQRTRAGLLELFEEHLGFLERSNEAFDGGALSEAKRMAVSLRVLFHKTSQSRALVHQLGFDQTLTWVDTAGSPDATNLLPEWGLVQTGIWNDDGTHRPNLRAPLGDRPPKSIRVGAIRLPRGSRIQFAEWWKEDVVKDADGTFFSRRDFVLALANKEGGAHVDPQIQESYNKIANLNSMGWTFSESPDGGGVLMSTQIPIGPSGGTGSIQAASASSPPHPGKGWSDPIALDNPVPYAVRQISYEVVESVRQQRDRIE